MSAVEIEASGWRLPDDACALLARLVMEHEPELVLECGSGRSTVVLAEAVGVYGGYVVALEHMPSHFAQTQHMLRAAGVAAHGHVAFAPLTDGWYARPSWRDLNDIGMLVVDGPPGGSSRYARGPAVPLLRDRLLPGCVVILDDYNREPEQTIWREWGIEGTVVKHAKATLIYGTLDGE